MSRNVIYNEDCILGMKRLDSKSVDLALGDPPFGIKFGSNENLYNRKKSRVLDGYIEVPQNKYYDFTSAWVSEVHRVLKDTGSFYLISGFNNLEIILRCLRESGFKIINHLVWQYQFPTNCKKKFNCDIYHVLFVAKDSKKYKFYPYSRHAFEDVSTEGLKLHYADRSSVFKISRENWRGYLTTKTRLPAELISKFFSYSSVEKDLILDCFVGSGQGPLIARSMGRDFIGYELSLNYFKLAQQRLTTNQYKIPA